MPRIVIAVLSLSSGLLCSVGARAELLLSEAWVRAMPPTRSVTAAYLELHNTGSEAVTVRGASADVSPRVELHTTLEVDGLRRMQAVPELSVAPGERIGFRPGGLHLMLMDMPRMPAMGETVQLCLLTNGDNACTTAPVQRDAAAVQP